ncbi:hypothetical protein, partial [Pseudomonas allii]|uniref:hypothetical protein n=1 Tax=Pseudomonas allii TaxID=2740531 RepID=UPI0019646B50
TLNAGLSEQLYVGGACPDSGVSVSDELAGLPQSGASPLPQKYVQGPEFSGFLKFNFIRHPPVLTRNCHLATA